MSFISALNPVRKERTFHTLYYTTGHMLIPTVETQHDERIQSHGVWSAPLVGWFGEKH